MDRSVQVERHLFVLRGQPYHAQAHESMRPQSAGARRRHGTRKRSMMAAPACKRDVSESKLVARRATPSSTPSASSSAAIVSTALLPETRVHFAHSSLFTRGRSTPHRRQPDSRNQGEMGGLSDGPCQRSGTTEQHQRQIGRNQPSAAHRNAIVRLIRTALHTEQARKS